MSKYLSLGRGIFPAVFPPLININNSFFLFNTKGSGAFSWIFYLKNEIFSLLPCLSESSIIRVLRAMLRAFFLI